jgi:hypothetical protein
VYTVALPALAFNGRDFEYYVEVKPRSGPELRFPASAPALNQTVVVMPR